MVCYKPLCRPDCRWSTTAPNGDSTTCIALEKAYGTLQSVFQHSIFRPGQYCLHFMVEMFLFIWILVLEKAYSYMAVGAIISPLMDEQVKIVTMLKINDVKGNIN